MDITDRLTDDHTRIRTLMARIATVDELDRDELFRELVAELAAHETAEGAVLWPVVRRELTGGAALSSGRIAEEEDAEETLAEMEGLDPTGDEFMARFAHLRIEVERHVSQEESQVFPALVEELEDYRLAELDEQLQRAKAVGPTHPHPHAATTPPLLTALGPIAGAFDRARDAIRDLAR